MNQILSTSNNYNNNNYNKIDTKKIIIFFCIAIILIAIIIISVKIYGIYKGNKDSGKYIEPVISIGKANENSKEVTIQVTCEDGIDYLIYTWNNEKENRVNLNGSAKFERMIDIPSNSSNTLTVSAVSVNGISSEKKEEFKANINNYKSVLNSMSIVNAKLQIEVSDDDGIEYLAYQWENEDEVKINADENDNKTMTAAIDIQRGTYNLKVKVVDIFGNEESLVSQKIVGVKEPEINVIKYGDVVNISVTHDMGFKQIEYIINNIIYTYNENYSEYDKNQTTIEFDFPLKEGENIVKVNAYSLEKLSEDDNDELENYSSKKYIGKCTYEIAQ